MKVIKCCKIFQVRIIDSFLFVEVKMVINFNKDKGKSFGLWLLGAALVCTYEHITIVLF